MGYVMKMFIQEGWQIIGGNSWKGKSNEPDSTSTKLNKELLSLTKSLANMVIIVVVPQNIGCCWGERLWQYDELGLRSFLCYLYRTLDQYRPISSTNCELEKKSDEGTKEDENHMWFILESHVI
jgi:hypothetical protein